MLRLGYGTEFIGLVNAAGLLTFAFVSLPAGILGSRLSNSLLMKIGAGHKRGRGLARPSSGDAANGFARGLAGILLCAYAGRLFLLFRKRLAILDQRGGYRI